MHPAAGERGGADFAEVIQSITRIAGELRKAGTPLPTNDVWVAALALREGATVITCDEHFRAVRRIGAMILRRG